MAVIERLVDTTEHGSYPPGSWPEFVEENPWAIDDEAYVVFLAEHPSKGSEQQQPSSPPDYWLPYHLTDQAIIITQSPDGRARNEATHKFVGKLARLLSNSSLKPTFSCVVPLVTELIVTNDDRAEYLRRMLTPEIDGSETDQRGSWVECWSPCSDSEREWLSSWLGRLSCYPETVAAIEAALQPR